MGIRNGISETLDQLNYHRVLACEHIQLSANPLTSDVLNVAISGSLSHVLVVEEQKVKLICWKCVRESSCSPFQIV